MTRVGRANSGRLHARAVDVLPGGVNSNVRLSAPRIYFARADGAWLWDVDGNDYVDYLLGQGPQFLGHTAPAVTAAVADACRHGMTYGAQHPLELEAAELVVAALGWADMVRFGVTGTEMVQAALRLARAATGRRRFLRFEGHYHGWLDGVLVPLDGSGAGVASAGQLDEALTPAVTARWNDLDALEQAFSAHGDELAAVIMEPMMCNVGAVLPCERYLPRVRQLCDAYGVVLIFDEVISGFRVALGGAAQRFGVTPDLATYGKAMAGGWPVAALAGRGELMQRFGTGEVNHSGTFNASVMAAAATVATLRELTANPPYERISAHGTAVMDGLRKLAQRHDLPLQVNGLPMAFHCSLSEDERELREARDVWARDTAGYARLAEALIAHGVWVAARGIWYVSAAHGDTELQAVLERFDATLATGSGR
jgi:glutamate-1-semialdehyde 2,1-aminomutase